MSHSVTKHTVTEVPRQQTAEPISSLTGAAAAGTAAAGAVLAAACALSIVTVWTLPSGLAANESTVGGGGIGGGAHSVRGCELWAWILSSQSSEYPQAAAPL